MSSISKRSIYLDNAASTPTDLRVLKEMSGIFKLYANPSSFNQAGRNARKKLEESRMTIARFLGAQPEEIIFTSSGSEANNLAILGLAQTQSKKGEIITTPIEHPSVLKSLRNLQKWGWQITYLKINKDGLINLKDLEEKLNSGVVLVSIIYANNEIGTIQPIKTIAKIINHFRNSKLKTLKSKLEIHEKMYPFFHVDACQAAEYLDINVNNLGVDLLTFNGAKIYGPKGSAVLYKRRGVPLEPLVYGGDQEHGLRAGTENLVAIAGLARAVSLINRKTESERVSKLRDYFLENIISVMPDTKINGATGNERLANNINISIPGLFDENLLLELDKYGIYASSGSACTARSIEPSHVLKAIGVDKKFLGGALRFSLGRQTTKKDIDYVLKVLSKVVGELRQRYK